VTKTFETREAWLTEAIESLRTDIFAARDLEIPAYRVSVGWPGGRGKKSNVVGQCWNTAQTEDGTAAIFISPTVKDPVEVLSILVHEIIHAIDDCVSGHRGAFVKMFRKVGMVGKATQSAAGEELSAQLASVAETLGAYPHAAIKKGQSGAGEKKQSTRMLKVVCLDEDCGYSLRTTRQWLDVGLPTCACGEEMAEV
jgi:hypothetical protein